MYILWQHQSILCDSWRGEGGEWTESKNSYFLENCHPMVQKMGVKSMVSSQESNYRWVGGNNQIHNFELGVVHCQWRS